MVLLIDCRFIFVAQADEMGLSNDDCAFFGLVGGMGLESEVNFVRVIDVYIRGMRAECLLTCSSFFAAPGSAIEHCAFLCWS